MTKAARGFPLVEEPEHCSGVHISAAATTFSHTVIFGFTLYTVLTLILATAGTSQGLAPFCLFLHFLFPAVFSK